MEINDRFLAVMQHSGLNKGEFAQKIGVSQGVISHIGSGRNKPGLEMITAILHEYPEISADWLVSAKGEMLRPKEQFNAKAELLNLLEEIRLVNKMNYNNLTTRIDGLSERLKRG